MLHICKCIFNNDVQLYIYCIVLYFFAYVHKRTCMFDQYLILTLFMTTLKYTCAYDLDRNPGLKVIITLSLVKLSAM